MEDHHTPLNCSAFKCHIEYRFMEVTGLQHIMCGEVTETYNHKMKMQEPTAPWYPNYSVLQPRQSSQRKSTNYKESYKNLTNLQTMSFDGAIFGGSLESP